MNHKKLMPLNLQFFAETKTTDPEPTETTPTETNKSNPNVKETNNSNNSVDVDKVKSEAVNTLLGELGVEDVNGLKEILAKQKELEDKNKSEVQLKEEELTKTTKALSVEMEKRILAEAKISAISLGAKPELVEDLVIVARAKVTKDKDINEVIAEIKDSKVGNVYFGDAGEGEEKGIKGNSMTRKRVGTSITENKGEDDKKKGKNNELSGLAERLFKSTAKAPEKSSYF